MEHGENVYVHNNWVFTQKVALLINTIYIPIVLTVLGTKICVHLIIESFNIYGQGENSIMQIIPVKNNGYRATF